MSDCGDPRENDYRRPCRHSLSHSRPTWDAGHPQLHHGRLKALTGAELEKINDEELPSTADDVSVFARVTPEQKLRLVKALQTHGHVVAMTGDGVNDAPVLKQANIGVAMGITGTDVAKGAAAMVLTDDNFASIEAAVEEGRSIFDNLLKFIAWTLPTNTGQSLILLVAVLLGTELPIAPVQMLWVNMVTALLLGLMLVFEPREEGLMTRSPRPLDEPLLSTNLIFRTALVSVVMLVGAFLLFNNELRYQGASLAQAQTTVVNVTVMVQVFYLLNCRSLNRVVFPGTVLQQSYDLGRHRGHRAGATHFHLCTHFPSAVLHGFPPARRLAARADGGSGFFRRHRDRQAFRESKARAFGIADASTGSGHQARVTRIEVMNL